MEIHYSFLTLQGGDQNLIYRNKDQFIDEIEQLSGIFVPDQIYFSEGRQIILNELLQHGITYFQVGSKMNSTSRYYIKTPQGKVKVYLPFSASKKIQDLAKAFLINCKKKLFSYPINEYAFKFDEKIMQFEESMANIQSESEFELIQISLYPDIQVFGVHINSLIENESIYYVEPTEKVKSLKQIIFDNELFSVDKQKLIFSGMQLHDEKELSYYGLKNGSVIELMPKLSTGAMIPHFSFNSIEEDIKSTLRGAHPAWRQVYSGFSWLGNCNNNECSAFKNEVICNHFFGIFDIQKDELRACCPLCNKILINVQKCGFFNCRYKFYGVQKNGSIMEASGIAQSEKYTLFMEKEIIDWEILRIQVELMIMNRT